MELSNLLFYFSMINMLCIEKKQSYEQKPEWHFPLGGGEMPEECNNITYNYIMLFKCVTYFTNSI